MLDLEYIKKNTLWVARMTFGTRFTGTYDEIKKYENDEECKDIDILASKGQPKELQKFYESYEYATSRMNRSDLFSIDDFYREWSKNPNQFSPEMRPVIGKISSVFDGFSGYPSNVNILITNYDKRTVGNHYLSSWTKALQIIDTDYDVVEVNEEDKKNIKIVIQTDHDSAELFAQKSNSIALDKAFK